MSGSPIQPELWDAVVVGAGPAGCAAAYDLATAGKSVLLLDRCQFPRPKACAGGLTGKAVKALRYSIHPVVRETVHRVRLEGAAGLHDELKSRDTICVMTVREELDAFCLQKTMAAGAGLQRISGIEKILPRDGEVHLLAGGQTYRGRFLIGADGANGQVRRLCAPQARFSRGFAVEVKTAKPAHDVDLTFDFASVDDGYAWIFPKRDHLNVGLYVQQATPGLTRSRLLRYIEEKLGVALLEGVTGQYLGVGGGEDDVQQDLRDRVFLVGDAGGFVDALTGEGIYGAVISGQAAARAVLAGDAAVFHREVGDYRKTLAFSRRAAAAFYANPARGFRAMRLPLVRRVLVKTYTDGLNVNSLAMRIATACC
jgi:geranylgeranyl reductase family protein